MTAHDGGLEAGGLLFGEPASGGLEPAAGAQHETEGLRPLGHAVEKGRRFERGIDGEPFGRFGPVERLHGVTGALELVGGLQPGQDTDVVLGRRPPEDHGDIRHD